jgi:hypothetical protein
MSITDKTKIRKALDRAGYRGIAATENNLRECVMDYADTGAWRNMEPEDVQDLTVDEMVRGIMRLK